MSVILSVQAMFTLIADADRVKGLKAVCVSLSLSLDFYLKTYQI